VRAFPAALRAYDRIALKDAYRKVMDDTLRA
jgi:hypothetical protein